MFDVTKIKAARRRAESALHDARAAHVQATHQLDAHEKLRGTMPAADHTTGRMKIKAAAVATIREAAQAVPDGELHALAAELELGAILRRARSVPPLDREYHDALARDTREMHQLLLRRELRDAVAGMTPAEVAADIAGIATAFGPNDPSGATLERFSILHDHVRRQNGSEWGPAKSALAIATAKLESDWKGRRELVGDIEYIAKAARAAAAYEGAVGETRDKWPAPVLLHERGLLVT